MNAITFTEADKLDVHRATFGVMVPTYSPSQLAPVKVRGLQRWDRRRKRYLDVTSGIVVISPGRCASDVDAALVAQAGALLRRALQADLSLA